VALWSLLPPRAVDEPPSPFLGRADKGAGLRGAMLMRVSQVVIADRHAKITIDVMGDSHAPATASLVGCG
jgi:hypothetical protein